MKKIVENSKAIERSKEYQLQSNDISNSIYSCSVNARRLIAYCISNAYRDVVELKDIFSNNEKIKFPCMSSEFTFNDFFDRLKITNRGQQQHLQVLKAVEECLQATIKVQTKTEIHEYTWFMESGINIPKQKIKMTFNPMLYKAITEWYFSTKGYSALSLELLGQLSSFYAMRYYEMALAQMGNIGKNGNEQGQWFFERTISELKTMFNLHERKSYERTENFIAKVVVEPISQLNEKNKDFQIEVIKIKENRKTTGFRFVCRERAKNLKKITKFDDAETKKTKTESNKINSEIAFYKKKYPAIWKRFEDFEKAQRPLFGEAFEFQIQKDIRILELVKAAADSDSSLW